MSEMSASEILVGNDSVEPIFQTDAPSGTYQFLKGLVQARKQAGRKGFGVLLDLIRLSVAKRRVYDPERYFHFRLFEYGSSRSDEMKAFLDHRDRSDMNTDANYLALKDHAVDQKQYLEAVLRDAGVAVVHTQAILRSSGHACGKILTSTDQAQRFLRTEAKYPAFGKPVDGSMSMGAANLECYLPQEDALQLSDGRQVPLEKFVEEALGHYGEYGYMIQTRLSQHPDLQAVVGDSISCVRVVSHRNDDGIRNLYAVWKISAQNSVADNIWREGNLCAAVDVVTGEVLRCRSGEGVDCQDIEQHPITGVPIVGLRLPDWNRVLEIVKDASTLMSYTDLIGWDVAMTDRGPVIVEGNTNPEHGLYQLANQEGLLSTDFGRDLITYGKAKRSQQLAKAKATIRKERDQHTKHIIKQGFSLD